jgi:hypothetical protein
MRGFIEITSGGVKSIISTRQIAGVHSAKNYEHCRAFDVPDGAGAIITHVQTRAHLFVDETYEQIRDALEKAA